MSMDDQFVKSLYKSKEQNERHLRASELGYVEAKALDEHGRPVGPLHSGGSPGRRGGGRGGGTGRASGSGRPGSAPPGGRGGRSAKSRPKSAPRTRPAGGYPTSSFAPRSARSRLGDEDDDMVGGAGETKRSSGARDRSAKNNRSRRRIKPRKGGRNLDNIDTSEDRDGRVRPLVNSVRAEFLDEENGQRAGGEWDGSGTFAAMEGRSHTKKLSRSARIMMEELRVKREEEEAHLTMRFKAKEIPQSTLECRYEQTIKDQELRREANVMSRKQRLLDSEKPFRGMQGREAEQRRRQQIRDAANRLKQEDDAEAAARAHQKKKQAAASAAQVGSFSEALSAAERERRSRITARSQKALEASSLPRRMEMWEQTGGPAQEEAAARKRAAFEAAERGSQFRAKKIPSSTTEPRFQRMVAKEESRRKVGLESRKRMLTDSWQPFEGMEEREAEAERVRGERHIKKKAEEEARLYANKADERRMASLAKSMQNWAKRQPGGRPKVRSTAAQSKRDEIMMQKREEEEKKRELELRKARKKKAATKDASAKLGQAVKNMMQERVSNGYRSIDDYNRERQETAAQKTASRKSEASDRKSRWAQVASGRPLLFQRANISRKKDAAYQASLRRVSEIVYSAQGGDDGGGAEEGAGGTWQDKARDDGDWLLNEQEKDAVGVYDDDDFEDEDA